MRMFRDNENRAWELSINTATLRRIKGLLNIDILGLCDQNDGFAALSAVVGNPLTLVDIVFVACKTQADRLGVTDEDFGRAMFGDAIQQAAESFMEDLIDFFPEARRRAALKKLLAKGEEVKARTLDLMEAKLTTALNAVNVDAEAEAWTKKLTNLPDSSALTPGP